MIESYKYNRDKTLRSVHFGVLVVELINCKCGGIVRNETEMLFKLSNLNSNLALTLGYLNPALNNSALAVNR